MQKLSIFLSATFLLLLVFSPKTLMADIIVEPHGITEAIEGGEQMEVNAVLTNTGDQDISFEVDIEDIEMEEEDERGIAPRRDRRSEPDDMDYEWRDNLEDDGPEYEWLDIREWDGTREYRLGDDVNTGQFNLEWEFPFWDEEHDRVFAQTDGWMSFTCSASSIMCNASRFPYAAGNGQLGNATVSVYNDDNLAGTEIWIWTNEDDMAVISWAGDHQYHFQLILYGTGLGVMQYGQNIQNNNQGGEVGVNLGDGDHGWRISGRDNNYTRTGRAIGFGPPAGWVTWVTTDPEEGVIEADDEIDMTLLLNSETLEEGYYYAIIRLVDPENDEIVILDFPVLMSVDTPVFAIGGTITDEDTDEAVVGATVTTVPYDVRRNSVREGAWEMTNLQLGAYELIFTAADFLPHVEEIGIDEAGEYELDVALLHSECTPSREEFFMELEPDMDHEFDFTITNGGNGPLTYTTERRLLGEANAEPWELREAENIEDVVNDDMLNGVVFAAGHFFVAGGNNGDDVSKIYKINTAGELVDEFDQFNESRYGMRDLAYDGNLIWGADNGIFYGFTTDCELETSFESPVDIEGRSIAWDPDNQVLIASDIATDIYAIDLEGDLFETFERPAELRVYGLGFWPDDPDGYDLYVFCRGDTTDLQVNKFNLEDGDYMVAAELNIDGGRPGGVQITNQLDVYSWVFITIVQNPDRLAIWQLEARKEWFQVEPVEGVIEAEESVEFVLTLDATGLPSENTFEGEVVFSHDGVGAETVLSVRLDVVAGAIQTTRDIPMEMGWNLVSANLQPDDEENIRGLMAALVEEELLVLMKNSDGEFYRPDYDYNNIPGWYVNEGYQMLVSNDCVLTLEGMSVLRDRAIPLEQGWQIASYYPRFPIDAIVALSGIVDHLIIAKDGRGNFYLPDWNFSNMGDMCEGQGYYLNVDEDIELVYQTGEEANALVEGSVRHSSVYDAPGRLPVHAVTGENMSLLVLTEAPTPVSGGGIEGGGTVGVYAGDQLVGSGVLQDGICGIAVWGDDPATEAIDGALEGQPLEVHLLDDNGVYSVSYVVLSGRTVYRTDSFAAIRLNEISELPSEFGIISTYPNPFNARTRIVYGLPEAARVDLAVYDLSGRRVSELASGRQEAGIHTVTFEGSGFASGVYMVHLEAGGSESLWKVALIK